MNPLHHPRFLRAYWLLPHHLLNQSFARLMRAQRPARAVTAAIDLWARRARINLAEFEPGPYASLEAFFLRRLKPGARPLHPGLVAPVDGHVVAAGDLHDDTQLLVKGQSLSLQRVVNGQAQHQLPLSAYQGGRYVVLFLSPRGYHYVHMPDAGQVVGVQWLPGRYFPQNDAALQHIPAVYEQNERLVLRCALSPAPQPKPPAELLLVMVGASLVGGINLRGLPRAQFSQPHAVPCHLDRQKGEELGHFTFGSTVVLLLPRGAYGKSQVPPIGSEVRMGETLFAPGL